MSELVGLRSGKAESTVKKSDMFSTKLVCLSNHEG